MKFIVNKNALEICVKNLCKVINSKSVLPILGDIRFDIDENDKTAKMTASDSEIWLSYTIALNSAEGGGSFCVCSVWLAAMLAQVSEQPLTITATTETTNMFTMDYQDGSAFCPVEKAEEYPMPQSEGKGVHSVKVDAKVMKRAIKRSLWTTAEDELRPVMNGVYFDMSGNEIDIVATDGHHMMKTSDVLDDENETCSFIMPKKVAKLFSDIMTDGDIELTFDDRRCAIETDNSSLQFLFIEGKYPNYNSIIPSAFKHEVGCDRHILLSALMAVNPFSNGSSNMIVLTFEGDNMEVSGNDYDMSIGAMKKIRVEGDTKEKISIGVKASPLITLISKLQSLSVVIKFNDPSGAIVIVPADDEDDEQITGITMPMLIND